MAEPEFVTLTLKDAERLLGIKMNAEMYPDGTVKVQDDIIKAKYQLEVFDAFISTNNEKTQRRQHT